MSIRRAFVAGIVVVTGCASAANESDPFADEKVATEALALDQGVSAAEMADVGSANPAEAARSLAEKTKGCRTRTIDATNPNVVHVALAGCSGRFDRHVLSGELTITFSAGSAGSLHAESVSRDLTIDGRAFSRTVSSDIQLDGDLRTVTRHAVSSGTNRKGESVAKSSDETIVANRATRCRTVNGTAHALVGGTRNVETTITDLSTCETADGEELCPTGTIAHVTESKGKTVTQTFDGTPVAKIATSKPKGDEEKTWTLACQSR